MKRWKKVVLVLTALLMTCIGGCVVMIGPWPTYSHGFEERGFYTQAVAAIQDRASHVSLTAGPGRLQAGWAKASIVPPVGTPLAGFGARKGAPSTGVHDDIFVTALVLSDGEDTVALVGSDMLLVPNNVADIVRATVGEQTTLTGNDILFNASHSHSGPGAFGPGFVAEMAGGAFDPAIVALLAERFSQAIIDAYKGMEPARVAHGSVDEPKYIRNRTREAPVDSTLNYLVVEQDDADRLYVVRYSAHPTVIGADSMVVSGEYPGYLKRAIEAKTGASAMYLGGAVGSMGPNAPAGADDYARAEAMGEALAQDVLAKTTDVEFESNLDIAAVGIPFETPSFQIRLTPSWRLSPFLPPHLGLDNQAWMGAVRVGDVIVVGVPADFSGEISRGWQAWGLAKGLSVWPTSFNADYVGYVSPDRYYLDTDKDGGMGYEIGTMSWMGPHQEAFFTSLMEHMVEVLTPENT